MLPNSFENPLYELPQDKRRILIPKTLLLLFLGTIFYIAILLDISFLDLSASEETITKFVALILVIVLITLGAYLSYRHAKPYHFYRDRISLHKKEVYYLSITKVEKKQNFLDKMFKTYTLDLGVARLDNISEEIQIDNYVNQLVNYAKSKAPATGY